VSIFGADAPGLAARIEKFQFLEIPLLNLKNQPVIRRVRYFLAHTPGLVRHGSKPAREIARDPALALRIADHLRPYEAAVSYPPNQAFLGGIYPDDLRKIERPWYLSKQEAPRRQPHGEIMPEEEFYGLLKICDSFDLIWLETGFARMVRALLDKHPLLSRTDLEHLGSGKDYSAIEAQIADRETALPLYLRGGTLIGCIRTGLKEDAALSADILLENLACKAAATMALKNLLADNRTAPESVEYIINSGEEAVGDRYQRGGGNMAKAVGEMCGCVDATGIDVKGFCCGPNHALLMAGSLVSSAVFKHVAVIGGCSLAKLGMKFQGHLSHDQPILEDVLAGMAVLVSENDGKHPVLRLDSVGRHEIGAGSAQKAIIEALASRPLKRLGMQFRDIDKYATELHNPEVTEPAGSGNVPLLNYRLIGSLAVLNKEIRPDELPSFVEKHGMPGFSPTQGHIASAVPFLGHAVDGILAGKMEHVMFLAKGSLFLGRMTQLSDGLSFIVERNRGT
jgi:betaine reductase